MKRYSVLLISVFIVFLLLLTLGCDRRGYLNEKETQALYDEIETWIQSGEIWEYEADVWLNSAWGSDDITEKSLAIVKAAANAAFDPEAGNHKSGVWLGNKNNTNILHVELKDFTLPGDKREGIRVLFSVYRRNSNSITIIVSDIEPGSDTWKSVTEVQFHKDR